MKFGINIHYFVHFNFLPSIIPTWRGGSDTYSTYLPAVQNLCSSWSYKKFLLKEFLFAEYKTIWWLCEIII